MNILDKLRQYMNIFDQLETIYEYIRQAEDNI